VRALPPAGRQPAGPGFCCTAQCRCTLPPSPALVLSCDCAGEAKPVGWDFLRDMEAQGDSEDGEEEESEYSGAEDAEESEESDDDEDFEVRV